MPHGLKLIVDAFKEGKTHFVRSDISGFFDNIPRGYVQSQLAATIKDQRFLKILDLATTTVLANEIELGEDRKIFPIDSNGVAQGSPLSPLFGNILLYEFDVKFNDRGIVCVRFIDDFILLGENEKSVARAFENAKSELKRFGLDCHDPYKPNVVKEKASFGSVDKGFVFLGYDIRPGLLQPSAGARRKLEEAVDEHIKFGRNAIIEVKRAANSFEQRQRYAQTLTLLDKVLRGWGDAFRS